MHEVETVVRLDGVSHFYGSGSLRTQVLFDVSVEIRRGEIALLTGPSGSGKTTLLTLVGCLRAVQTGRLVAFGEDPGAASPVGRARLRRRIGWIFQLHHLLRALSALENVRAGLIGVPGISRHEAERRSRELLARVGLAAVTDRLPEEMSIGQRQRVAIARALVGGPDLVLADEPTAALDGASGRRVVETLRSLAKETNTAVLIVTHDDRIFDVGDRLLRLEEGRLAEPSHEKERRS